VYKEQNEHKYGRIIDIISLVHDKLSYFGNLNVKMHTWIRMYVGEQSQFVRIYVRYRFFHRYKFLMSPDVCIRFESIRRYQHSMK